MSFAAIAVAVGLSLLIVHPAPSYDPLAWLLWGREVAGGALDTREGPAFKPLPVGVGAVLAPTGTAAPWLWIAVVRAAAVVCLWLAFRIARRLAGGSRVAGALAAVGVALCGGFLGTAAAGAETPLLLALALGGVEAWRRDRFGLVLACAIGCSLVRVEAVPFAALAGAVLWRRQPGLRPALVAAGVLVPAAWILPELVGSGDPLRSADRARVPNPGQPALADVPSLAALEDAVRLPLWCLWIGLVPLVLRARGAFARAALAPAAVGVAWLLLVAAMAEVGFSGEARYSLPGAALVAISGAIGLAVGVRGRVMATVAVALVAVAAVARLDTLSVVRERQAYQWTLAADLRDAIRTAGGRDAVLECGRPYVGPLRGPLLAYWLEVRKRDVEPDDPPRAPGVVFRSAIAAGEPADPPVPGGFARVSRSGTWETWRACAVRDP
ncbi:MAG: hypothetical protein QOI45_329 [Thermoleophilaceae bacterium]|nr:hypothetical protein [Thermoleophilaceae bacterium]